MTYLMYVDQILNRLGIGLPISVTFLLQFFFVTVLFSIAIIATKKINYLLIGAMIIVCNGIILGVVNGWYVKDIFADATRYIIPFLAYYVGLNLVKNTEKAIHQIVKIEFLLILITVSIKVISLIRGEPIIFYGRYFIYVSSLIFFMSFYTISSNDNTYLSNTKAKFCILAYFISPILRVSKTNFIMVALSLFVIKIKYKKIAISIIGLLSVLVFIKYQLWNTMIIERFISMYESISSGDVFYDSSTGARIGELVNALKTLMESPWVNLHFGLGSGALWYQDYIPIASGLNPDNFRPDGGGHHIHMTPIAIIFRHGVIGLALYLYLFLSVLLRIRNYLKKHKTQNNIYIKSVFGFIVVQSISMVFTYSFYGFAYHGFILGLAVNIMKEKQTVGYE